MLRRLGAMIAAAVLGTGAAVGVAACGEDRSGDVQFEDGAGTGTETAGTETGGTVGTETAGTATTEDRTETAEDRTETAETETTETSP